MSADIGIKNLFVVGNRVRSEADAELIRNAVQGAEIIGLIPYSEAILATDRDGISAIDNLDRNLLALFEDIIQKLL